MSNAPYDPTSPSTGCPLTAAISAVGGKWSLICLYWLAAGPRRFNEIQRLMPDISHKVLTAKLRDLEREGLVTRTVGGETPATVDYSLSSHGETLRPLIELTREWGRSHLDRRHAGARAAADAD